MAKGNFWGDLGDQALEFGAQTAKKIPQQVVQTMNPIPGIFEKANSQGAGVDPGIEKNQSSQQKPKSTPLDLGNLEKNYQKQDNIPIEAMKQRLFRIVKEDEQKGIRYMKRQEDERKQKEQMEEQEKQQKRHAEMQQNAQSEAPQGKVKRMFGMTAKKAVQDSKQEYKAGKGAQ